MQLIAEIEDFDVKTVNCAPISAPLFTILINSYNYGQYVEQAIRTALTQTIPREQFEVLVIDDGSTDDTRDRIAKFGDNVRYYFQNNGGQAAAFNAGLARANGRFIAFLDADDFFTAEKLHRVSAVLAANPEIDLLYHSVFQVDAGANLMGIHPKTYPDEVINSPINAFVKGQLAEPMPTSGIVASNKLLQQILPVPLEYRICADSYIHHVAPLLATAIGYFSEPLAYYRIHASNHYNCYDKRSGLHSCKEERLVLQKTVNDLKAVESISLKFNIDVSEYLDRNSFKVIIQKAIYIRDTDGVFNALKLLYQNLDCLQNIAVPERVYRILSISIRLISGPYIFGILAGKFVNSLPHRMMYRVFYGQRGSSL